MLQQRKSSYTQKLSRQRNFEDKTVVKRGGKRLIKSANEEKKFFPLLVLTFFFKDLNETTSSSE